MDNATRYSAVNIRGGKYSRPDTVRRKSFTQGGGRRERKRWQGGGVEREEEEERVARVAIGAYSLIMHGRRGCRNDLLWRTLAIMITTLFTPFTPFTPCCPFSRPLPTFQAPLAIRVALRRSILI